MNDAPYAYHESQEWGQGFTFAGDSLPEDIEALSVIAQIHNDEELSRCIVVMELHDAGTDSIVLWHSSTAADGQFLPGDHAVADAIVFNEDLSPKGKTIKTYLWNQDKKPLIVNKLSYYYTKKNRVLTGLYDPLN